MLSGAKGARSCVLLLAWGLTVGSPSAQEVPTLVGADDMDGVTGGEAPVATESRLEDLSQRLQGMEGKLKESAAARKAADQARMEAERRLAEGTQELVRLRAEVGLLRDANLALEARLEHEQERAERNARDLAAVQESLRRLTAERETQAAEREGPKPRIGSPAELPSPMDESGLERLRALSQEQSELRRALAERESDLRRIQLELRATQAERDALSRRLEGLWLVGSEAESGGLTLAEARAEAGVAAAALREAMVQVQASREGAPRRALRDAAQDLQRRQLQVARLMGARGVYRVGPGDSLALIAGRYYGDARRWIDIEEANRPVVSDPDHLIPGLTLVIP